MHWGTFALAMHDWDEPAETLLALGPKQGARLLMPRLGEGVEPGHEFTLAPWWRAGAAQRPRAPLPADAMDVPKAIPWPLD